MTDPTSPARMRFAHDHVVVEVSIQHNVGKRAITQKLHLEDGGMILLDLDLDLAERVQEQSQHALVRLRRELRDRST